MWPQARSRKSAPAIINADPTVALNWTGEADSVEAFFYSDHDPVLVVQTPDGEFLCNDDANAQLLDPVVQIDDPASGRYNIWVGAADEGHLLPGILVLTTRPEVNSAPLRLATWCGAVRSRKSRSSLKTCRTKQEPCWKPSTSLDIEAVALETGMDPVVQEVTSEGDIPAFEAPTNNLRCTGFVADTPDYVFEWSGETDLLRLFFEGDGDATLIVATPDSGFICNDDALCLRYPESAGRHSQSGGGSLQRLRRPCESGRNRSAVRSPSSSLQKQRRPCSKREETKMNAKNKRIALFLALALVAISLIPLMSSDPAAGPERQPVARRLLQQSRLGGAPAYTQYSNFVSYNWGLGSPPPISRWITSRRATRPMPSSMPAPIASRSWPTTSLCSTSTASSMPTRSARDSRARPSSIDIPMTQASHTIQVDYRELIQNAYISVNWIYIKPGELLRRSPACPHTYTDAVAAVALPAAAAVSDQRHHRVRRLHALHPERPATVGLLPDRTAPGMRPTWGPIAE